MSEHEIRRELDLLEKNLVTGIREFMRKCGFRQLHLGLSGGIDSALVAYLAVQAAGCENVTCIGMPTRFSSPGSVEDSKELAENLSCRFELINIDPLYENFLTVLEKLFTGLPFDTTEENLQSRIRGTLLMAFSNKFNSMLLACGNKSELAMGYCTLYGDMNGSLAPIGDLFKTEVYALCRRINEKSAEQGLKPSIPQAIIDKPPSAELRPDQKDQDSLPPYEILDEILAGFLHNNLSKDEIVLKGKDERLVENIIATVGRTGFKRRQAPPVIPVSRRVLGEAYEV